MDDGCNAIKNKAEEHAADSDEIREEFMVKVNHRANEQEREPNPTNNTSRPGRRIAEHQNEQYSAERFNERITERNACMTICAASPKRQIGKYRDILIPLNERITVGTMRRRAYNRFAARDSPDHYVQKGRDNRPESEDEEINGVDKYR